MCDGDGCRGFPVTKPTVEIFVPSIVGDDEVLPVCPSGVVMTSPSTSTTLSLGWIGLGVVENRSGWPGRGGEDSPISPREDQLRRG